MQDLHLMFAILVAMVTTALFTAAEIPLLKKMQFRQFIREEGPKSHFAKEGTPTMGGFAIFAGLIVTAAITGRVSADSAVIFTVAALFGLVGFFDDFIKVVKKHNLGLRAWQKLILQILFASGLAVYMVYFSKEGTDVWIPVVGRYVNFGWWYIPFVVFVVVATANSVNLTDGLDGLSSGVTAIVSLFFGIAGIQFGHSAASSFCCSLGGACLGFLIFNRFPAKLFMGDTGSMLLGGALAAATIVMKAELLLPVAGLVYVMEALSVIIQVISFQTTGKRVFKMAPIHHHFEMCGMKEKNVVAMFWLVALICCVMAYFVMNI